MLCYHPASFAVLSVILVLKIRRLRLLRVVYQKGKLDSVMKSRSMTASPSKMDLQQIPGIIASGACYAQITNSTSLRKHKPRDQIRQQSAKPSESQDSKSNIVIFGVEEHDFATYWIQRSLRDVGSVTSILSSLDENINNYSVIDCRKLGKFDSNKTSRPILARLAIHLEI